MIYAENIFLCIAVPLVISMLFIKGNTPRFIGSFIVGMGMCLIAAYISGFISYAGEIGDDNTAVYISPVIEEVMKFLPLFFYLAVFLPEDKHLLTVAVGIGAGFATLENSCYILSGGAENIGYILIRGMAVGVMHIVSVFVLAFAVVLVRKYKLLTFAGTLGALSFAVTFHGLYNLLVSGNGVFAAVGYALPLFTAFAIFMPYYKYRKSI